MGDENFERTRILSGFSTAGLLPHLPVRELPVGVTALGGKPVTRRGFVATQGGARWRGGVRGQRRAKSAHLDFSIPPDSFLESGL